MSGGRRTLINPSLSPMATGPCRLSGGHREHKVAQSMGLGAGQLASGLASAHMAVGTCLLFCLCPQPPREEKISASGELWRGLGKFICTMCLLSSFLPGEFQGFVRMFICCLQIISLVRILHIFCSQFLCFPALPVTCIFCFSFSVARGLCVSC